MILVQDVMLICIFPSDSGIMSYLRLITNDFKRCYAKLRIRFYGSMEVHRKISLNVQTC